MGAASRLRFLTLTLAAGFVLALAMGSAEVFGGASVAAAQSTITVLAGDVVVRHAGADFAAASDGDVLNEGDTIRTGADGRAIVTYFEGSSVTVEPATELTIDAASVASDGGTIVLMTQSFGRTWHVVTKLITGGSRYEVRTPASTASVRGTEFQVDASSDTTTVSTTEGTVVQQVPDPAQPANVAEVRVAAGTMHTQRKNAAPAAARAATEADRVVTVHVGATNTLVVDPLGRANGVTKDGRVVAQTPGAQVRRDGDTIVVVLPNLPDGRVAARVDADDDSDVDVTTTVQERGSALDLSDRTKTDASRSKIAGFELAHDSAGNTETRALDDTEKQTLPRPKVERGPASATPRAPAVATPRAPAPSHAFRTLTPRASETARPTRSPSADADRTPVQIVATRIETARSLVSRLMPALPTVAHKQSRR